MPLCKPISLCFAALGIGLIYIELNAMKYKKNRKKKMETSLREIQATRLDKASSAVTNKFAHMPLCGAMYSKYIIMYLVRRKKKEAKGAVCGFGIVNAMACDGHIK